RPQSGFEFEKSYFLGEASLVLSSCSRHVGLTDDAKMWIERSVLWFSKTPTSAGRLADLGYLTLTLRYETGSYAEAADGAKRLAPFFGRFGLSRGSAKCRILEGQALKALNRVDESISVLEDVRAGISVTDDDLLAFATVPLIELYMRRNDLVKAGERF